MAGKGKYIAMVVLSAILYGSMPIIAKLIYEHGGNNYNVTLYEALFAAVFLAAILKKKHISLRISLDEFKKLAILGAFGSTFTILLLYYSYSLISAGLATTLHYIYPVAVTLMLIVFSREKASLKTMLALGLAVGGIALISGAGGRTSAAGVICAVLSGICWAFYIVYLDKSGLTKQNGFLVCFYVSLINIPVCGAAALITGNLKPLDDPFALALIAAAAFIGRVVAGPLFQKGIGRAGSMSSGILSTLEPITSMLLGWIVLREALTAQKTAGAAMVLCGVIVTVLSEKHTGCVTANKNQ